MLIIYPTIDWNSFISVADADIIIEGFTPSVGKDAYLALDEAGKEAQLRQASFNIRLCPNITLPDDTTLYLEMATCYLVVHEMTIDTMSYDPNDKAITSESVDTLSVTYDAQKKGNADDFPPIVSTFLKDYGCQKTSTGFRQVSLGRG